MDTYLLNRDYLSSVRLDAQHWAWRQELGFNIHPSISTSTTQNSLRIADVAAGTGAWLLEVSRQLPHAQCDGFDIDLAQAPQPSFLPANVAFHTWNMFEPPPAARIGLYDIVHIRLVCLAIGKDPLPTLKNLVSLLKPGGYLQWDEMDPTKSTVVSEHEDPSTLAEGLAHMDRLMKARGSEEWILRLPEFYKEFGLEDIAMHRISPDQALIKHFTHCVLLSWLEVVSRQPDGDRKVMFSEVLRRASEDVRNGAGQAIPKVIIVGKQRIPG